MIKFYGRDWNLSFSFTTDPVVSENQIQHARDTVNNLQWLAYHDGLAQGAAIGVACGLLFSFLLSKIR